MRNHDFDRGTLDEVAHRPWPMPDGPWLMTQTWHELLFAHWAVEPGGVRALVPAAFELDLHEGRAWIGIVPFHMTNVAPRGVPSLPGLSEFPELNVRTYVRVGDRPGIYFFSLDAGSAIAAATARTLLNLPYHAASMRTEVTAAGVEYSSRRDRNAAAVFRAVYRPAGAAAAPRPGTLEHFLTERYCLYNLDHDGAPYRLEIHHPPWPLQPATAEIEVNGMGRVNGLALPADAPLLHYAKRQDMVAWRPTPLGQASGRT